MSTALYYNNAYAQSGIKYSSKDFLFRITATNALKDKRRGHSLTVNYVYTQSNSKEQHLRNSGGLQRLFMQRSSCSSSRNNRLLFNHTLTERHIELIGFGFVCGKKLLYAVELQISLTASSRWRRGRVEDNYIRKTNTSSSSCSNTFQEFSPTVTSLASCVPENNCITPPHPPIPLTQ